MPEMMDKDEPPGRISRRYEVPDLQTQLEEILNAVWKAEADWRLDDRLDMALKIRRTA